MKSLNIVFAGTPAFTLPSLDAIKGSQHNITAVYTQPDRPAGRGRKLQASPVKQWAEQHLIPVYQPLNFKQPEQVQELAALEPDVMVVIAYGLLLPPSILSTPTHGCINVHASLLPRWRGASPIQHAILFGDKQSGVTIMQMDKGMDTGDMLAVKSCDLSPDETASTLHNKLAALAMEPLLKTLDNIARGSITPTPQDDKLATYAPKIKKEAAHIDWNQASTSIDCLVRAYNPWPIAYTHADDIPVKLSKATMLDVETDKTPGTILELNKSGMVVATKDGALQITQIQFPGKKAMDVASWLNAGRSDLHTGMVLR
jgi:methionyl-tRNA formyltransferase